MKVVAEFFQKAEDVGDAADCGQGQGVLLLVKVGWTGQTRAKHHMLLYWHGGFRLTWKKTRKSNMSTDVRVSFYKGFLYVVLYVTIKREFTQNYQMTDKGFLRQLPNSM